MLRTANSGDIHARLGIRRGGPRWLGSPGDCVRLESVVVDDPNVHLRYWHEDLPPAYTGSSDCVEL